MPTGKDLLAIEMLKERALRLLGQENALYEIGNDFGDEPSQEELIMRSLAPSMFLSPIS